MCVCACAYVSKCLFNKVCIHVYKYIKWYSGKSAIISFYGINICGMNEILKFNSNQDKEMQRIQDSKCVPAISSASAVAKIHFNKFGEMKI